MPTSVWILDPEILPEDESRLKAGLSEAGIPLDLREFPAGRVVVLEDPPADLRPPAGVIRTATVDLPEAAGVTRRLFLDRFAAGLAVATLGGGAVVAGMFSAPPKGRRDEVEEVEVGTLAEIRARGSQRFRFGREPCIVIWDNERLHALSTVCSHLGCLVNWAPGSNLLHCPCHRAVFDLEGNVREGPPPRPLRTFQVSVLDGRVLVRRRTAR